MPARDGPFRRGAILIMVLIILSGLSLLAFSMAHRCRVELRIAQHAFERAYTRQLAQAGLVVAMDQLRQDTNRIDHAGEDWYGEFTVDGKRLPPELRRYAVSQVIRVRIRDEESKLDVNRAAADELAKLPGLSREAAAGIRDWIDEDDEIRLGGAETAHYLALPTPYRAKNKPLENTTELLLVKGIDHRMYGGGNTVAVRGRNPVESKVTRADPAGEAASPGPRGLGDLLTVYSAGKINLNTVPLEVLLTVSGLSEQSAESIIRSRDGADGIPGTDDDAPFEDMAQMSRRCSVSEFEMDMLRRRCQLNSTHFSIVARGEIDYGRVCCQVEMVVRRTEHGIVQVFHRETVGN